MPPFTEHVKIRVTGLLLSEVQVWQLKWREWPIGKLKYMFILIVFNETVSEPEKKRGGGGSKLDESQKRGRAAGSLLAEITLSLIATVEWSCQKITGTAWGCSLSAGIDEQKVPLTCSYLTGMLSTSRALCLMDCQTKKSSPQAGSSMVTWIDKRSEWWTDVGFGRQRLRWGIDG